MKEIKVVLDDDLFAKIKTEIGLKKMCDSCYTLSDNFVLRLINAIDNEEEELALEIKKPEDKGSAEEERD